MTQVTESALKTPGPCHKQFDVQAEECPAQGHMALYLACCVWVLGLFMSHPFACLGVNQHRKVLVCELQLSAKNHNVAFKTL